MLFTKKDNFSYACLSTARNKAGSPFLAGRTKALFSSHQLVGNFFHYRTAIGILGLDYSQVFDQGRLDLDPDKWADFGPLNFHMGPPPGVLTALKEAVTQRDLTYYPPNIIPRLKAAAARVVFRRECGPDFEIMATEGVQAALAYAVSAFVNPGEEVIITDPGYFFLEPPVLLAGGKVKRIPLRAEDGYRVAPGAVEKAITPRTKALIVCDPVNPFGTVQTRRELEQLIAIADRRGILLINNATHGFHRLDPAARHYPMSCLTKKGAANVLTIAGLSHGFGLAGLRIGFLGGPPALVEAVLAAKSAVTRINLSMPMQLAALAALEDRGYLRRCEKTLRANFSILREVISSVAPLKFMARPRYGFFGCVDTSGIKASCQELTVALLKRKCAVYPSDGLGDTAPSSYLRLNFSTPRREHFSWLRQALPGAIKEAESGKYRAAVLAFFRSVATPRARRVIQEINYGHNTGKHRLKDHV
ncbi:MAG: pyridoxal phosphate-dependent aminotransferase [Elusimicrobiales bacterium]|nr:pyridoxal phosphate-dependent aminotransferase [Elusimicrobiales bacterium]